MATWWKSQSMLKRYWKAPDHCHSPLPDKSVETDAYIHAQPKWIRNIYGYFNTHWGRSEKMREQAKMSQKRKYPIGFVFTFVEGDDKEFDYGTDIIECAIIKFLRTQYAEESVPYICLLDFLMSKAFNRGLITESCTNYLLRPETLCL